MNLKFLREFRDDQSGGILAFTLVMFMVMVVGGGMAVDFMNFEYRREGVQDALDRGVLAAAGLGNDAKAITPRQITAAEQEAVQTVFAYVRSAGYDPDALGIVVTPDFKKNSQLVAVQSNFEVDTYFLRMAGIQTLFGAAASAAQISQNEIEISMVLDVSGSMDTNIPLSGGGATRRLDLLQNAANDFVGTMLDGNRSLYTTISLVPFSGQVAASDNLIAQYPNFGEGRPLHSYSNCVRFWDSDYSNTDFDPQAGRRQYQHFFGLGWRSSGENVRVPMCPGENFQILPFSNDAVALADRINGLEPQGSTSTWAGIKWGVALLDPASQPVLTGLTNICSEPVIVGGVVVTPSICDVDSRFAGRPAAYTDDETLKFLIVIADGRNTGMRKMKKSTYDRQRLELVPGESVQQQRANYWNENPAKNVRSRTSASNGDLRMDSMCTAAKDKGIVIFTIGVDINYADPDDRVAYDQMNNCASSPSLFYSVQSTRLDEAFSSISQTIQKLKLIN